MDTVPVAESGFLAAVPVHDRTTCHAAGADTFRASGFLVPAESSEVAAERAVRLEKCRDSRAARRGQQPWSFQWSKSAKRFCLICAEPLKEDELLAIVPIS